jgi:hypothetical protein
MKASDQTVPNYTWEKSAASCMVRARTPDSYGLICQAYARAIRCRGGLAVLDSQVAVFAGHSFPIA